MASAARPARATGRPPRFDSFFIEAKVPENMPIGSHVTQIRAIDYDEEGSDDSRISYSIRAGDGLNSFSIDDNGQIRTLAVLDREAKESYWLTVYAMDHGAVPLYSELQVFIEVLNLNDNIPLTVFPVYFPTVMENAKPNTPIVTIEAFDADNDPNQQMVFAIVSGDPQSPPLRSLSWQGCYPFRVGEVRERRRRLLPMVQPA